MAQRIRVRCPTCGLIGNEENIESGPYRIEIFVQVFGGKAEGGAMVKGRGKGSNPGRIEYHNITNTVEGRRIAKKVMEKIGE